MTLPASIQTVTCTFGKRYGVLGTQATIQGTVKLDRELTWEPTGDVLDAYEEPFISEAGGFAQLQLPYTDQAGFTDGGGNTVTDFSLILEAKILYGGRERFTVSKPFQLPTGLTGPVDIDMIAGGSITLPVVAPQPQVNEVAGKSGVVTDEELLEALTPALSATFVPAPPTGGFVLYATDDEAVADANPDYAWVILEPAEPPDTTAPTVPTGLSATPGDTQVVLDWTDSTDAVGVTGYRVRRGGTLIASPTTSTYTDTGRTNGVQVSYTVSAIDAAGNESAQTSAVTATPAAAVSVIASDDFTRANSLSLGSTPVGSKAWTKTGAAGGTAGFDNTGISGNQLQVVGNTGSAYTCVHLDSGVANHDVTVKVAVTNAGDKLGPMVRYADNDNVLRLAVYTTGWDLTNVVGGTLNAVVPFTGRSITSGDTWRLRIAGNTYTVWHNGTQISTGSVTTANTSATRCGVSGAGTGFTGFADDFSVSSA